MARSSHLLKHMMFGGFVLALFAFIATAMVAVTFENTKDQIAENEKQSLINTLNAVIDASRYDNELYADVVQMQTSVFSKKEQTIKVYRARRQQQPVAAIMEVVTPEGYGGPIRLLIAVNADASLAGVRVVSHRETPGLGDGIERNRSNWIDMFINKSLSNPQQKQWRVKKDGGVFDQLTGATITPRAVVKAVKNSLLFYRENRDLIFQAVAANSNGV